MSSLWSWMLRLLLLFSLAVLGATLDAIWPDSRHLRAMDIAGVVVLSITIAGVALWAVTAWLGDPDRRDRTALPLPTNRTDQP